MATKEQAGDAVAGAAPTAGPSPVAELRQALTAVDDAVAGLGGDIGSVAAADPTHVGPLSGRHQELQQLLAGLRRAADRLDQK